MKNAAEAWRQLSGVVRLRAFDTASPEGRSRERHRRAALTSLSNVAAKIITGLTLLVSIRLTLSYLGTERYAVWVVIVSTLSMLTWSDLGLGNGLMNTIAEHHGREDRAAARRSVASAVFMLGCVSLVILAASALLLPHIDWVRFLKLSHPGSTVEYARTFLVCTLIFALGLPLGVVSRIHGGFQEGYVNNFYISLGSVAGLLGILIVMHLKLGLVWLALALAGCPMLASLANAIYLFGFSRPWLFPRPSDVRMQTSRLLLQSGLLFLVLQLATAIGFQSDNVVVAHVLGAGMVPAYSLPSRIFQFVPVLFGISLATLWPAYRESVARGDLGWAERTFYRSLLGSIGFNLPMVLLLVLTGPFLLRLWVGNAVPFSRALLVALAVQVLINSVYNPITFFLNGMGVLAPQAVFMVVMAVVNITLSILLTRRFGISGVVWGSSIALLFCSIGPGMYYARRAIRQSAVEKAAHDHGESTGSDSIQGLSAEANPTAPL